LIPFQHRIIPSCGAFDGAERPDGRHRRVLMAAAGDVRRAPRRAVSTPVGGFRQSPAALWFGSDRPCLMRCRA
jgi:hypothetical protein